MAGCKKYSTVHCKGVVGARRLECAGKAELMAVSHPLSPVSFLPLSHGWMDRRKRNEEGGVGVPGMKLAWLANVCGVPPFVWVSVHGASFVFAHLADISLPCPYDAFFPW